MIERLRILNVIAGDIVRKVFTGRDARMAAQRTEAVASQRTKLTELKEQIPQETNTNDYSNPDEMGNGYS